MINDLAGNSALEIVAGAIIIIGAVMIFVHICRNREKGQVKLFFSIPLITAVACFVIGIILIGVAQPAIAASIGALATVGAAFLALVTIWENRTLRKLNRQDDIERETRERKERLLNEIISWACDFNKEATKYTSEDIFEMTNKQDFDATRDAFLQYLLSLSKDDPRLVYISAISSDLDDTLKTLFTQFMPEFKEFKTIIQRMTVWFSEYDELIKSSVTSETKVKIEELNQQNRELIRRSIEINGTLMSKTDLIVKQVAHVKLTILQQ
jgi:hypothetical protein